MKKTTTYLLIVLLGIACNSQTTQQHIVDTNPFAQGVSGHVKKIRVYEYQGFVSTADSIPHLSDDNTVYTGLHYDENGHLISITKTEVGVTLKQVIEYDNEQQKGFLIKGKDGEVRYTATTTWQGASTSTTAMVNKKLDTAVLYTNTYDKQTRVIKTNEDYRATDSSDNRFPKGATLIVRAKEYSYGTDGYINSITYLQGNPINGTTTLSVLERDEENNPTLLQQLWRKETGEKNYSAIRIEYEYYQ